MLQHLLALINWHYCMLCNSKSKTQLSLCQACYNRLPWLSTGCQRCAKPLPNNSHSPVCGSCIKQPPYFDSISCPLAYTGAVRHLITQLKFHQKLNVARLFANIIATKLNTHAELIIPVPLHPTRCRQRGYNQAFEIGRIVAKKFNLPIDVYNCQRIKATQPQSGLAAGLRQQNIKNAFGLKRPIRAQHIVIIDDVTTTMSTLNELSKLLKRQGATTIEAWCCARAID